jgi:hypothetical protein
VKKELTDRKGEVAMNRFEKMIGNHKYWIGVSVVSLALNLILGSFAWHYYEINSITVVWHKSNDNFRPHVEFPGVCYEKEIVVDGNQKTSEPR